LEKKLKFFIPFLLCFMFKCFDFLFASILYPLTFYKEINICRMFHEKKLREFPFSLDPLCGIYDKEE